MKKSEIFACVLDVVAECTEVSNDVIVSDCRTEDAVMARCMVVHYGMQYGLSRKSLQELLRLKSHNSIRYYIDMYSSRRDVDRYFRCTSKHIGQKLGKTMSEVGQ